MNSTHTETSIPVHSVMQRHPVSVLDTDTIQDAVDRMSESRVSAMPVVDENRTLLGILSVNDMLRLVQETEQTLEEASLMYEASYYVTGLIRDKLGDNKTTSAMSASPVSARQDESLQCVAKRMLQHQVHHIPVVNSDNKLVGIISSIDFVRLATDGT